MERRRFMTSTGTGALGVLGAHLDEGVGVLLQDGATDSAFDEFVDSLDGALTDLGAGVVDGAAALGYGVLLLTTRAEGPGEAAFDEELAVVANEYLSHVEGGDPPAVGLVVEVYGSADAVGDRMNPFATYAVRTEWASRALETGDRSEYATRIRASVSPPVWAAEDGGEPAVELAGDELIDLDGGDDLFGASVGVEAAAENRGNGRSGTVEVVVDWYDEDGSYLDTDSAVLQTLRSGETWVARVYPGPGVDGDEIEDYEATLVFDQSERGTPDGLEIEESNLHVNGEARIHGALANETGEELSYVEAIGRVLDAEGRVLGDDWTNDLQIEAGATWRFDLRYGDEDRNRLDAIERHEVIPLGNR